MATTLRNSVEAAEPVLNAQHTLVEQRELQNQYLDWDDQLLFDEIHGELKSLRESLNRLEFVSEEVKYLLALNSK